MFLYKKKGQIPSFAGIFNYTSDMIHFAVEFPSEFIRMDEIVIVVCIFALPLLSSKYIEFYSIRHCSTRILLHCYCECVFSYLLAHHTNFIHYLPVSIYWLF